ncbi:RNA polymerase subunit sigma-70 [Nocardia sp. NPDC051750]|uniref:RNA polymerase subunit sigma-70 n=1 Tax=Nocardia sp. NPDC051750 TaxID=3364325 RepID=UPI00379BDCD2
MSDSGEFARLSDPYRRELIAYCYRMVGSVDEAEDLVQETYLRAWRSYSTFEGRSSLRTWLYRIATNSCLTALDKRSRRPLPSGLGGPSGEFAGPFDRAPGEIRWLQPIPDTAVATVSRDPAAIVIARDGMRLALIAALQLLPARQRAVLILRDVLGWPAADVADLLDCSTAAVKSALQRARAQLERVAPEEQELTEPAEPDVRALLSRYMEAFEDNDMSALVRVLHTDIALEMPPFAAWFRGRGPVTRFVGAHILDGSGRLRMVATAANGQPAAAAYRRGADGVYRAHAIHVLGVVEGAVSRIVAFLEPGLFQRFGLPGVHAAPLGVPRADLQVG